MTTGKGLERPGPGRYELVVQFRSKDEARDQVSERLGPLGVTCVERVLPHRKDLYDVLVATHLPADQVREQVRNRDDVALARLQLPHRYEFVVQFRAEVEPGELPELFAPLVLVEAERAIPRRGDLFAVVVETDRSAPDALKLIR